MVDIGYNLEGLFIKDRLVTNYIPMVRVVYAPPDAPADQISVLDCCLRFENGNSNLISLPFSSHLAVDISRLCPSAVLFRQSAASAVQQFIVQQLQGLEVIKDPLTQQPIHIGRGLLLAGNGTYHLPTGQRLSIWNHRLAGSNPPKIPFRVANEPDVVILEGVPEPLQTMCQAIIQNDPALVLTFAFALLSSHRDVINREGCPLRGGLYITAPQSAGKTTLAQRVLGYAVRRQYGNKPALFWESVSTEAAVRDALTDNPNLVLIIDDLCRSSSRSIEKRRRELGAAVLRLAANEGDVAKKGTQGQTEHKNCSASIALTAEFVLDSKSELTRSILVNLTKPLHLTSEVQPALIGSVLGEFADWFEDNYDAALHQLHEFVDQPTIMQNLRVQDMEDYNALFRERRIEQNLALLQWAFSLFVQMVQDKLHYVDDIVQALYQRFWHAVHTSVQKQVEIMAEISSRTPEGNIAYVLLWGIDNDVFDLCSKKKKLFTHEGILWETDNDGTPVLVGIKQAALVQFVRAQNGYHDASSRQIIQELKDYGALVLQEDKSNTVHLGKTKKGQPSTPRVLLIKYEVLKNSALQYISHNI